MMREVLKDLISILEIFNVIASSLSCYSWSLVTIYFSCESSNVLSNILVFWKYFQLLTIKPVIVIVLAACIVHQFGILSGVFSK